MKTIFLLFLCVLLPLNVFGQSEPGDEGGRREVAVEEIFLARDDGDGKAGETVTGFITTDVPIHCGVQLASTRAATVKMNFVAVKVPGVKAETKVVEVSYKTNGRQNRVNFTGSPDGGAWIAGNYRIDIFIDGKAGGSKSFEIQPAPPKVKEKSPSPQKKPDLKPRLVKRIRKNQ